MKEFQINELSEDDVILLESLIKSPAFGLLKKVLSIYRGTVMAALTSCKDANEMFVVQGRLLGLGAIENLPGLIVQRRQMKIDIANQAAEMKEKFKLQQPPEQPAFKKRASSTLNRPPSARQDSSQASLKKT